MKANSGYIFDIQGLSVHDGPGCRTVLFMQGCTLNCIWCSNPEGINLKHSILYNIDKCRLDGNCMRDCKYNAISLTNQNIVINRQLCTTCTTFDCVKNCYTKALTISSKKYHIDEIMKVLNRDRNFWGKEGGLTISGGEPLLQIDFIETLLHRCYDSYIHTAVETCGNIPWANFERTMQFLDWIFIDFKHPDNVAHKRLTGSSNEIIKNNISMLRKHFSGRLVIRIPIIPEVNNTKEALQGYLAFFTENKIKEINLLPLHHLGKEKYPLNNKEYRASGLNTPSKEEMETVQQYFNDNGLLCYLGNQTPF